MIEKYTNLSICEYTIVLIKMNKPTFSYSNIGNKLSLY